MKVTTKVQDNRSVIVGSDVRPSDSTYGMPAQKSLPMGGAAIPNQVEAYFGGYGETQTKQLMEFLVPKISNSYVLTPPGFRQSLQDVLEELEKRKKIQWYRARRSERVAEVLKELDANVQIVMQQLSTKQKA